MNGLFFNGRTSRKFRNVAVQKRGRGGAKPTIPLMKERTMTRSTSIYGYKDLMNEGTPRDRKSNLKNDRKKQHRNEDVTSLQ
jgi:hypothetical protein